MRKLVIRIPIVLIMLVLTLQTTVASSGAGVRVPILSPANVGDLLPEQTMATSQSTEAPSSTNNYSFIQLAPSDLEAGQKLGRDVAVSGQFAVIGSPYDDDLAEQSGSAYVYHRDGTEWVEFAKLIADDGHSVAQFGNSVAIEDDIIVVGAKYDDAVGNWGGAAYVFRRNNSEWIQEQKLLASDGAAFDRFGIEVAIQQERIVVGASYADAPDVDSGAVYIFQWDGQAWEEEQKLTASDGQTDNLFGDDVAINGDTIAVGAVRDDTVSNDAGAVYIFELDGSSWIQRQELHGHDIATDDHFGNSIALDDNNLLVGSTRDDDRGSQAGAAYVFTYNGTNWTETQKLLPDHTQALNGYFGNDVALHGNVAVVAAYVADSPNGPDDGKVYAYRYDSSVWQKTAILSDDSPSDGYNWFGMSVALDSNSLFIGSFQNDDYGTDAGAAFVFDVAEVSVLPEPLTPNFRTDNRSGPASHTVHFIDISQGEPTEWDWDFGDGNSSTEQNPTHVYQSEGLFTITLTVKKDGSELTITKPNYISVGSFNLHNSVRDEFNAQVYNGNDGTEEWANNWVELGDNGSPSGQNVGVYADDGVPPWQLIMRDTQGSISRSADLSGANSALLSLDYRRRNTDSNAEHVLVEISSDGNTWEELDHIGGDASDPSYTTVTYDISSYISDETAVRLTANVSDDTSRRILFDNIQIAYDGGDPPAAPVANFTYSPDVVYVNQAISFTNSSQGNLTSHIWTFGDESDAVTTLNATHTYTTAGTYTVRLEVANNAGSSVKEVEIDVLAPTDNLEAIFSANPTSGQAPLTVTFSDSSTGDPDEWIWSFGDQQSVTLQQSQSVTHVYDEPGTYTVSLTVRKDASEHTLIQEDLIHVGIDEPPTHTVRDEFNAQVYNGNDGTVDWSSDWVEFGDNGNPNGQHVGVYEDIDKWQLIVRNVNRGLYRSADLSDATSATLSLDYRRRSMKSDDEYVRLEISSDGPNGTWTELDRFGGDVSDSDYTNVSYDISQHMSSQTTIRLTAHVNGDENGRRVLFDNIEIAYAIGPPPADELEAIFTADTTSGKVPLTVTFSDSSTGSPDGWLWNFGDGQTETQQQSQPIVHGYDTPGTYTVSLTVSKGNDDHTLTRTNYITVTNDEPPTQFVRDEFNAQVYNGNDGSVDWSSDWIEFGDNGQPNGQHVGVYEDIDEWQLIVRNVERGLYRSADLSEATSATLTLDYRRRSMKSDDEYVLLEISSDGPNGTWTELDRFGGDVSDADYTTVSYDISGHMSNETTIRFTAYINGDENGRRVLFDNIEIAYATTSDNLPPETVDDFVFIGVETPVIIDILANDSDPDGDDIFVNTTSQPANGSVTINDDGTITYTANSSFSETDSFTYKASDGLEESNEATVTITAPPQQSGARIIIDPQSVILNGSGDHKTITATIYDEDGNPDPNAVVQWSSDNESIVNIVPANSQNHSILLEAKEIVGSATITATSGDLTAHITVAVVLLAPNAKYVDASLINYDESIAQNQVVLEKTVETEGIQVGDILISNVATQGQPGLLARAENVYTENNQVIVDFTIPSLSEALLEFDIEAVGEPFTIEEEFIIENGEVTSVNIKHNGKFVNTSVNSAPLNCQVGPRLGQISVSGVSVSRQTTLIPKLEEGYRKFGITLYEEQTIEITGPGILVKGVAAGFNFSCSKAGPPIPLLPITYLAFTAIPSITVEIGADGNIELTIADFELTGPTYTSTTQNMYGFVFDNGNVTTMKETNYDSSVDDLLFPDSSWFVAESGIDAGFRIGAYLSFKLSVQFRLLGIPTAELDLLRVKIGSYLEIKVPSNALVFEPEEINYKSPSWKLFGDSRVSAILNLKPNSTIVRILFGPDYKPAIQLDTDILKLELILDQSSKPTVSTSTQTVQVGEPITFETTIQPSQITGSEDMPFKIVGQGPPDVSCKREFGTGQYDVLGFGTVDYTLNSGDSDFCYGEFTVSALAYGQFFGELGLPYKTSEEDNITLNLVKAPDLLVTPNPIYAEAPVGNDPTHKGFSITNTTDAPITFSFLPPPLWYHIIPAPPLPGQYFIKPDQVLSFEMVFKCNETGQFTDTQILASSTPHNFEPIEIVLDCVLFDIDPPSLTVEAAVGDGVQGSDVVIRNLTSEELHWETSGFLQPVPPQGIALPNLSSPTQIEPECISAGTYTTYVQFTGTINPTNSPPISTTLNYPVHVKCTDEGGISSGDPHLQTYDGLTYDFQAKGEFVLSKDNNSNFEVQVRQLGSHSVSWNHAVAMQVGADRVGFYIDPPVADGEIMVNGEGVPLNEFTVNSPYDLPNGGKIIQLNNQQYVVHWPNSTSYVVVSRGSAFLNLFVSPDDSLDNLVGLLGNKDDNADNDLMLRDSTIISYTYRELYDCSNGQTCFAYDDSKGWLVDSVEESLFDYELGSGPNSFADKNYPGKIVTISDYELVQQDNARATCRDHGIPEGQALLNCMLDLLATINLEIAISNGEFFPGNSLVSSIINNFDLGSEDWEVISGNNEYTPSHNESGGNPNGYISISDPDGATWYWSAPLDSWELNNLSAAYDGVMTFDLKLSIDGGFNSFSENDVILQGNGITLVYDFDDPNPEGIWTSYIIPLNEEGWIVADTNEAATEANMKTVLSSISQILIRGEFHNGRNEEGGLDNFTLNLTP